MDRRSFLAAAGAGLLSGKMYAADPGCSTGFPDVRSIAADLTTPPAIAAAPSPGVRARRALAAYAGTEVHHTLYLPSDWKPGKKYPVLVEYPGNGPYTSPCGDSSSGDVEDCNLGYGISAGQRFLWLALPFIDSSGKRNQRWWWGDVAATVNYCRKAVGEACHRFGGDPRSVILCGFSRGAIACNFIGLHDDSIAGLWLGFVASSHYDGVEHWDWEGSDPASARKRLYRLRGRASFVAQEMSTKNIEDYIHRSGVKAPFTFQTLPFRNHTDTWVLRDIPERRVLRAWVNDLLARRPGVLPPRRVER